MLLSINASFPEPRKLRRAVEALEAGEVIGYPTDTVYGLGCDLFNKHAIDRLYQIKQMNRSQLLAFICPDLSNVARYAIVEKATFRVLKHYLPGPYTFVLEATREVPKLVQTKRRTIGVRIPNHEIILALVRAFGRPIISTTAAPHGEEPYVDPDEIDTRFKGLAMVLDGGPGGLKPTTVVDLTTAEPTVIREGAGPIDDFVNPRHHH
ncbi:MAG TPA: L-threonylcarbamoyladenylate synthase [Polyangiaceae bacterium]|jgi:tRNA threonylcarbamoyl adenosine modification protein (Sua5/YciO/YrdC/YwlC family)